MDNASDRKSIREKEKAAKLADQNRREQITQIMSTKPGREWVWNMLERAHVFSMSFVHDPYLTAFNEGERNQGQLLLNDVMEACPDQYVLAMRESNERRTQRDVSSRRDAESRAAGEYDGSSEPGWDDQGPEPAGDGQGGQARH